MAALSGLGLINNNYTKKKEHDIVREIGYKLLEGASEYGYEQNLYKLCKLYKIYINAWHF